MKKTVLFQFIGLAFFLSACSPKDSGQEQQKTNISVRIYTVGTDKKAVGKEYIGIVEEDLSVSVSFPLMGNIDKIYVVEGQRVKKGDLLAELNAYSLTNAHTAALATLNQAEDAMKRLQLLYDKKSLPEIQYIEMQTNLEKARSAEAIAKKSLEDSRLTAPFSGIVGRRMAEAGENVLPNQAILTLLRIDKVKVKISVPEKEINTIHTGQLASIRVTAASSGLLPGTVSEKGITADRISHTYATRIAVSNSDNTLLPGMVCNVFINDSANENTIVVPNQCILKDGNGNTFVWKVIDGYTQKQVIKTGKQKYGGVEIITGLSVGDEIISEGYQKVSNGIKVNVL
ncbi:MAG: efflux RND transporter periplasmic adaptor subunit [Bacteroidales bacterium]